MTGDEAVWKRRFLLFGALRVSGLLIFFLGVAVAFGALVQPGGARVPGFLLAALGLAVSLVGPRLFRKRWAEQDR